MKRIFALLAALLTAAVLLPQLCLADGETTTDPAPADPVAALIAQLESIDTLEQMQAKRYTYKVKNNYYDVNTTSQSVIDEHERVRSEYEAYVSEMFAKRLGAEQAYQALTAEQKAQIPSSLLGKLGGSLSTTFRGGTYSVTPTDDEYTFEAVNAGKGTAYEVGNYMVSGEIPQTFILVDTTNGAASWTPNGRYSSDSNYLVTYCCDVETPLAWGSDYKRLNLEDAGYYGESASRHIRAILNNSYPFISVNEMKSRLRAGGLKSSIVDELTRADMISAVQMAVWTYANAGDGAAGGLEYFASIDIKNNSGRYFTPLHDYTNEIWDWLPGAGQRSYDARAAYRVNNLAYYLCNLPGEDAPDDAIVVSNIEIARADLFPGSDDVYEVGMHVYLNHGGREGDDLTITATSYNSDGSVFGNMHKKVGSEASYDLSVLAKYGQKIVVEVKGTQNLGKGVYFYEPEGGRDKSQCLVGVGQGKTRVRAEKEFIFSKDEDIDGGLRIYKTANGTNLPIGDITFNVYRVNPGEDGTVSEMPTEEEIARYAAKENLVGTITTDVTGYAALELEHGTYLVIEEHNRGKVVAPVRPFYITLPVEDRHMVVKAARSADAQPVYYDIISIYPKNEPVKPPEDTPDLPDPPGNVSGRFTVVKHDEENGQIRLEGAQFKVFRAAGPDDTNTQNVTCEGMQYAVVPVRSGGGDLVLTTGSDGTASSPALPCGVYFLLETKAPDGYYGFTEAVSVTVVSDSVSDGAYVYVSNRRGSMLPSTGGPGVEGLIALGLMLTLCTAAALAFTAGRRREA